jgi:hypothetical protein
MNAFTRNISILFILVFINNTIAQEFSISLANATSIREQFLTSFGYQIKYTKHIKNKNKLSISFNHLFSEFSEIDPTYFSLNDGKTYYRKVASKNQRISIATQYFFRIFKANKSSLYIGPEVSLNYYFYNKNIYQYQLDHPNDIHDYSYIDKDPNQLGFGVPLFYSYQYSKTRSFSASLMPEIALFSSLDGCLITINPSSWLHANIGVVFHIPQKTN